MKIDEAIINALKIQKFNPEFALCGSLSLILTGLIEPREVDDLDFVITMETYLENIKSYDKYDLYKEIRYTKFNVKENIECFKLMNYVIPINLFIVDDSESSMFKIGDYLNLRIQNTDISINYKKEFGRMKDLLDLKINKIKYDDSKIIPY